MINNLSPQVLAHLARRNGREPITLTLEKLRSVQGNTNVTPKTTAEVIRGVFSGMSL